MQTAPVNKIIPFSSVDGPGNRTAVFLQGCNWDCCYCHNPETRNLCVGCGACVKRCPAGALNQEEDGRVVFDPGKCVSCDTCIRICTHGSSPRICRMTPQQVFEQVEKQTPFIRGITVSGGECSLYPDFLTELFTLCRKAGLHTLMDSNGSIPLKDMPSLLEVTDGVMLDIKAFREAEHRRVTAMSNEVTLENAVFLAEVGKLYEIRTVVVPGLFDAEETIRQAGRLLASYQEKHPIRYKLISYRPFGVRKQYQLYEIPDGACMHRLAALAEEAGFKEVITT